MPFLPINILLFQVKHSTYSCKYRVCKKNAILDSNANILNNLISKLICLHLFLSLAIQLSDKGLLPKFDLYVLEKFYVKCK